ncbi:MAG TPA: hypothetical protein VE081_13335 [Sporichthyaceae bacterium]|nr:hypothetical protein [Sporichthyaceae bacterium]
MGAFDQFKEQAEQVADKAKDALGNKRGKAADSQNPEQAERGLEQESRRRRSPVEDEAREPMDSERDDEDGNWA